MSANGARIGIESRGIGNIAPFVIRHNRDVIAYFGVLRITGLRIERVAHRNIRRPGCSGIRAPRIKQLRIDVIRCVSCVIPDGVESSIGRYCECADPMPFALRGWIIVDTKRRTEGLATIRATHKHYIGRTTSGR